jgi:5'-phosphate synthase pdxT subunit
MILLSSRILDGRDDQVGLGALDIDVRRNGYGRQVDSFETQLSIPAIGEDAFNAVFIRAPLVERTGRSVEILASVEGRPVAVAQGPHVALGFHPEMTGDDRLHRLFLSRLHDRVASAA